VINSPNLHNIAALGGQFKTNIFEGTAKQLSNEAKSSVKRQISQTRHQRAAAAQQAANTPPAPPPTTMSGPASGPLPPNAAASGRARRQARAMGVQSPTARPTQASGKAPSFAPQNRANTPASGRRMASGAKPFVASTPIKAKGPAPVPTFSSQFPAQQAKPAIPFPSHMTHATPKFSNAQTHTPTIGAPKPSINPFQVNTIQPSAPAKPQAPKPPTHSLQFSDTSTKDNSPFPTHVHPEGSSNAILPHLSATETAKTGRPNEFTVGSRNVRGSGIAAMGSKLEESLMSRPFQTPAKRND
jgi:hypothetical protein